jgi:sugar phosphate isomerase/epimerase
MVNFSIYDWFGFMLPLKERLRLIKAAGFDGVLLWWGDESGTADCDQTTPFELARQAGLFVENIHTPFQDVNSLWLDDATGDHFESILAQCIIDCREYAIPTAVVHVSQGDTPPPPNQIGLDRLKRLVESAESQKVNLALENLRRPEYLDFIFANIQSDRLGFCYDSGHDNCYSKGRDLLTQYGSKLMALHLHDNDGTSDQHHIPGDGMIDWQALKARLQKTGYPGPIALEVMNTAIQSDVAETPEQYLKRAFAAVQRLSGTAG